MKANAEKKARNYENIRQIVDVLLAANYHPGTIVKNALGQVEFWVGPGRTPVVALHYYSNDDGFEVYIPITQSIRMDETLNALRRETDTAGDQGGELAGD